MRIKFAIATCASGSLLAICALAAQGSAASSAAPQAAPATPPAFAQCRACHSVVKGGPSVMGPNLVGVAGSVAGSKPGYAYSPAMKGSGIRWDRAKLDAYIANPRALVPGTKMASPPVSDAAKRKQIVDFLVTLK